MPCVELRSQNMFPYDDCCNICGRESSPQLKFLMLVEVGTNEDTGEKIEREYYYCIPCFRTLLYDDE